MSDFTPLRRVLHLTLAGLPEERLEELRNGAAKAESKTDVEIMALTEANGREALEKIFAADAVAVWGPLVD